MGSYAFKLKDPRWQRKRLEILQRDNFTCQECYATDKELNVHHLIYKNVILGITLITVTKLFALTVIRNDRS